MTEAKKPRVYLAGPDVFFENPVAIGQRLKAVCQAHGLEGVFPLDAAPAPRALKPQGVARHIFDGNCKLIQSCDGVLANLQPFRGPSADCGTVWEVGYAHGLGKPCVGYTSDPRPYATRAQGLDEHMVESFALFDNLMVACSCRATRTVDEAAAWLAAVLRGQRP